MYKNGLSYGKCAAIVLITHIVMLAAILLRGKYENPQQIIPLAVAVILFVEELQSLAWTSSIALY